MPRAIKTDDPTVALKALDGLEAAVAGLRRALEEKPGDGPKVKQRILNVKNRSTLALGMAYDYAASLEATTA